MARAAPLLSRPIPMTNVPRAIAMESAHAGKFLAYYPMERRVHPRANVYQLFVSMASVAIQPAPTPAWPAQRRKWAPGQTAYVTLSPLPQIQTTSARRALVMGLVPVLNRILAMAAHAPMLGNARAVFAPMVFVAMSPASARAWRARLRKKAPGQTAYVAQSPQ